MSNSFDPRVNRLDFSGEETPFAEGERMQWQTYEVFAQQRRGEQHTHVGVVHAANPELALLFAKEQFGRREQCANLWVVRTADVHATSYEDADMFQHAFDKSYRESSGYRVKDTIEVFQRELDARLAGHDLPGREVAPPVSQTLDSGAFKVIQLPTLSGKAPRKIILKK